MKRILFSIIITFLLFSPSWSERVHFDELVERNGIFYKRFTDTPYTGEVGDIFENGKLRDGLKEGFWRWYDGDGSLMEKEHFRKGKLHGRSEYYYDTGMFIKTYKDGKLDGPWEMYYDSGELEQLRIWKDNTIVYWEFYDRNGKLLRKFK